MKTRTLIGAALLLSTTGIGIALAASDLHSLSLSGHERHERREASGPDGAMRFADSKSEHKRDGAHNRRHREDDDDDDEDDDRRGGRNALPQTGPADPSAPVPDNGLFNGKARPKVEVQ
ncbi:MULTISPECIES: hypothetical protein [Xanthobacter]|uniref:hypothetical protein n=1 Tax=Xanthobacter TaxID=279 RepID=UPI0024A61037|nr:hypothetical protein [Xanthobacter autotrophicus]MDI4655168.1 hypothetical protein [Xanthobacter autotrophicus]MDI4666954.1 hypothetical protein [Xanthobacter autotrophicus]